jgi:C4-dicarboxylate transporter/malic acid transport protein
MSSAGEPRDRLGYLGPNWFASIMGTGIIANAGAAMPIHIPGLVGFSLCVWVLTVTLLAVLLVATAVHRIGHPEVARSYGRDVSMAQYYGAPPMALLTVGAGAVLVGHLLIGERLAVDLDWVLWTAGTLAGLVTAALIPYRLFTQIEVRPDAAFGGWLMPIVPPMVSAATGALLLAHVGSAGGRATLLYACYAMFGLSLFASVIIITLIWSRLAHFGTSGSVRVPTLWIVLGPLGQSITAAGLLGLEAHLAVSGPLEIAFSDLGVLYGVTTWGFAVLWIALASALTAHTVRKRLPFALTWWSFTFPVGTFVTGTTRLAAETSLMAFKVAAVVAFIGLLAAWLTVATRTAIGSLRGDLFAAGGSVAPVAGKRGAAPAVS